MNNPAVKRLWSTKNTTTLSRSLPQTPHTGEQVIILPIGTAHTRVTQPIIGPEIISNNCIINKAQFRNIINQ